MKGLTREFSFLRSSISLSIAVHLFLLLCAVLISQRAAKLPIRRTTFIDLQPLPPQDLFKNNKAKEETSPSQRIVQTTKSQKTDKAAPNSFLGEQTQTVDRQTVSRDKMIQMGESKTTTAKHDSEKTQSQKAREKVAKNAAPLPLQNLGVPILPSAKEIDDMAKVRAKGEDRSDRVAQGEQAPKDYIKGLREGDTTALNTREFMFYGYYQRIRERLDRAWVPLLRTQINSLYRRGRMLASETDYATKVLVIMNPGGEIVKVRILNESGAEDLDDAAIKAFNMAGPFPNPPKGMADAKGEIQIPWEFILRT